MGDEDASSSLLQPPASGMIVGHTPDGFRRLASSESVEPNLAVYSGLVGDHIWLDVEEQRGGLQKLLGLLEMSCVTFLLVCGAYLLYTERAYLFPGAAAASSASGSNMGPLGLLIIAALCTDLVMYVACGLVTLILGTICGAGASSLQQASGFISVSVFTFSAVVWAALFCTGARVLWVQWFELLNGHRLLAAWLVVETLLAAVYVAQAAPFFFGIFKYLVQKLVHKIQRHPLVRWNEGGEPSWWWVADFTRRYPADALELGLLPR